MSSPSCRRRIATVVALGVGLAACGPAGNTADTSVRPAVASSTTVADPVDRGAVARTADAPRNTEVDDAEVDDDVGGSTAATTVVVPSESVGPGVDADAGDDGDDGGDLLDDEPSFELGPEVVLEFDSARFPLDDAGIGAVPVGAGADADADGDGGQAGADPVLGWAAVDRYLGDVLLQAGNTAASVSVSIDGDIVHSAAFGLRDPDSGDPAEPGDRFRVASISKPITALVVMRLVADGVVGLDEPIGQRVGDHVGLDSLPANSRSLTLRQLLTHRSGFGKYQSTFFRAGATDCADAARQGLGRGPGGGGYVYSNMNYCVAGLVIEAVTGLGYEAAVYRELLTPLGISGMRLAPTFDPGPGEVQHRTTPGRNYMETLGGAGAWVASPDELVTILDALDVSTPGYKPLPVESALDMITPQGATLGQRGYGLGLISYGGGRFGHTGTIESTHAMLLNRGDGVSWAITVAGPFPSESTALEGIMNRAFAAGGFVAG